MNPYASDALESQETTEPLPQGLSGATTFATIIMLVFGLSGLTSIFGLLMSIIQFSAATPVAPAQTNSPVASESQPQENVPGAPAPEATSPATDGVAPDAPASPPGKTTSGNPAPNPAIPFQLSPFQLGLQLVTGVLDFLLAIPMVLWSVQVLQRKRSAALRLSGLALLMAILEIPRGLFAYFYTPEILNSVKNGVLQSMEQQSKGGQQPSAADLDAIFQIMTYAMVGCTGVMLALLFFIYLFCFFQLRKPTTLARLSG